MEQYKLGKKLYSNLYTQIDEREQREHVCSNLVFELEDLSNNRNIIIFKCFGIKKTSPNVLHETFKDLITKEYTLLKKHSSLKPTFFIRTYDLLNLEEDLDLIQYNSKTKTEIKLNGKISLYGFTMENMASDLKKVCIDNRNNKKIDETELYKYLKQTLDILCYMQSEKFCHRDIKLENIFIDVTNKIRIGDLGTSRTIESVKKKHEQEYEEFENSRLKSVVGTESYMAPEIFIRHLKNTDGDYNPFKTDLYSLGITFLNLFTNSRVNLFKDIESGKEYFDKSLNTTYLSKIQNKKFMNCLAVMLKYDPEERPDLTDFREKYFDKIFTVENKKYYTDDEEEFTVAVKKRPIINPIISNDYINIDKTKVFWSDIFILDSTDPLVDYKELDKSLISLREENDNRFFNANCNEKQSYEIKSNKLYKTFVGLYDNKNVVISKFFFPSNEEQKQRFLDDINFILNKVNTGTNSYIVKCLGYVKNTGCVYLVSEHIESPRRTKDINEESKCFYSLDTVFKEYKKIEDFNEFFKMENTNNQFENQNTNFKIRLRILKQLLNALKYLKEKGICFGDLNLKKILIDKECMNIKLRNYGLFQTCFNHRYSYSSNLFLEKNGFFCWPPEFFDGYIDEEKSDMWALGVCIHQLFSDGSIPWKVDNFRDYLLEVIFDKNSHFSIKFVNATSIVVFEEILKNILTKLETRKDLKWVITKLDSLLENN